MPIETDLNISPYFDDYDESKDYHRVLFKPSVPLQARELTQLQSMLQTQIERFGNFQFKEGTIVKGCAFNFDNSVKYIKVLDRSPDTNLNVNLAAYAENDYLRHAQSNLVAQIVDTKSGFEAQDPDLGAIFLKYVNTGNSSGTAKTKYSNSDIITIIPRKASINAISVVAGGDGFAVADKIYLTSPNETGTGFVGTVASVSSDAIVTTTVDNDSTAGRSKGSAYSLMDYPYVSEIKRGDAVIWTTTSHSGNGVLIGTYSNGHSNTITLPVALEQEAQVTIAGSTFTDPVGSSYQMKVEDGIVYQKGNFQRFEAQSIIVSPFTKRPNNLSVGIVTDEKIANSSVDTSLLDNAAGFNNENAPGADRLSLTPKLTVEKTSVAVASNNFLSFVDYQNGLIVRRNSKPVLAKAEDHIAKRTYEESGDYVLSPIRVSTEGIGANTTHFNVLVGQGVAYVRGKRNETINTTRYPVKKATSTREKIGHTVTTNFGHYIKVKELVGSFGSDTQANVVFLDAKPGAITSGMATTITSTSTTVTTDGRAANIIGHGKIRALELESDNAGHADSVYQAYVYDIKMNSGQAFRNVQGMAQVATKKGICDLVSSKILDADFNKAIFPLGAQALKQVGGAASMKGKKLFAANIDSTSCDTSISAGTGNTFNFGTATSYINETQEQQVIIVSKTNATAANIATSATTSGTIVDGCTNVDTTLIKGDNVLVGTKYRQVTRVVNSTSFAVNEAGMNASGNRVAPAFVNNHIIPLSGRSSANVQVTNGGAQLNINFGRGTLSSSVDVDILVDEVDPTAAGLTKTVSTSTVRINPATGGTTGPWSLGIPDGIKLESVRVNGSSAYNSDADDTKVDFVLDNGQKDGLYGLSRLSLAPGTSRTIATTDRIIVVLKHFNKSASSGDGFFSIKSYDGVLSDKEGAGTTANTTNITIAEIPIFESPTDGAEISLRDAIDFRPYVANTATKNAAMSNTAGTINPSSTEVIDTSGLVSPTPNEEWVDTIEFYLPRKDRIIIEGDSGTRVVLGKPSLNPELPPMTDRSMQLATVFVKPYPSLDTKSATFYGRPDLGAKVIASQQKRFTMRDISQIEKRVDNLEYYSSLNALESLTVDQSIPGRTDATTNRFKNGFLVDNFTTATAGNPLNGEYKAGFDKARNMLTTRFERYDIDLKSSLGDSPGSVVQNDISAIKYQITPIFKQQSATRTRKCTAMFWEYNGTLKLFPDYSYKTDKTKNPELAMNIDLDLSADTLALIDELNKMVPELGTTREILSEEFVRGDQLTTNKSGNIRTTVYETVVNQRINETKKVLQGQASDSTTEVHVGDFVSDITFQPYMPAIEIRFYANGLRPNLQHHVFFDGVNVDRHCHPGYQLIPGIDFYGHTLNKANVSSKIPKYGAKGGIGKTNSIGEITGVISLPAKTFFTGKAQVIVADISSLHLIGEKVSSASKYFNSFNWSVETADLTMTTRHAELSHSSSNGIITTSNRTGTQIVVTDETPPPAANQSANTGTPDNNDGDAGSGDEEGNTVVSNTDVDEDGSNTIVIANNNSNTVEPPPGGNTGPIIDRCEIRDPCDERHYYHDTEMGIYGHNYRVDPLCCFDPWTKMEDPLAQSFFIRHNDLPEAAPGGFLSGVDLYFASKDANMGVTIELRACENGAPGPLVLPFSRVSLASKEVNISTNGTLATRVNFEAPVGVEANREYAIVIKPDANSPEYSVFTAKAGENDLVNAARQVNNDWGSGTLFLSSNDRTWQSYQDEDLKFKVFACVFTQNKATVNMVNEDYEFLTLQTGNNIIGEFVEGVTVFKAPATRSSIHKSGNLTYSTTSSTITGTGTAFATDYAIGDRIILQGNATSTGSDFLDAVTVASIASDTSMTVSERPTHASKTHARGMNTPSGIFTYLDPVTKTSQIELSTAANSTFCFEAGDVLYQTGIYSNSSSSAAVPNFTIGEVADHSISYFQPMVTRQVPQLTSVVTKIKAAKVSDNSYSAFDQVKHADTNFPEESIKIMSKSNEIKNNSGNKSVVVSHTIATKNRSLSPMIDFQAQGIKIFENSINNSSTDEYKTFKGESLAKYVSRTITLAQDLDAEDLKVFVNAYSPTGTEVKAYAKLLNEADTTAIDDAYWSELVCTANKNARSSDVDRNDVIEYTYELKDTPIATAQTGQIITTATSTTVTGSGTDFANEYAVGDLIKIVNLDDEFDYQVNTVTAIASATSMTLAEAMDFTIQGTTHSKLTAQGKVTAFRDPKAPIDYQATYYNDNGEKFIGFKRLAIKLVMLSDDNTKTPAIKDYRAIALSL